uniref:Phosphatidylinositol 3-kinase regulatory subunit n=1 Tax=Anopheles dirus TaxID=7168 RepID=A0A182NHQ5_9DIPT
MEEAQTQQGEQQQQKESQQQGFGAYIALEENTSPLTLADELAFDKDDIVNVWIPTVTKPPSSAAAEGDGGPRVAWYKATNARTKQTGYVQLSKLSPLDNIDPDPDLYSAGGRQYLGTVSAGACVSIGCACVSGGLQQQQQQGQQQQQTAISDAFTGLKLGSGGTTGSTAGSGPTDPATTVSAEELYVKCVTPATVLKDPGRDYIWGLGRQGKQCRNCSACFHLNCLPMALYRPCQRNPDMYQNIPSTFRTEKSINEWTTENVLEWMTAVNMYDHVEVFKTKAIKGCDLPNLDRDKLEQMGIKNDFHQQSILTTIRQLLMSADMTVAVDLSAATIVAPPAAGTDPAQQQQFNGHNLINGSFSKQQKCDMCKNYLFGLVHQGLFCSQCNLVFHRQCSVMNLRPCSAADRGAVVTQQQQHQQQQQLPASSASGFVLGSAHLQELQHMFGKSLCLLFDVHEQTAPQIVVDLCTSLEKKAMLDKGLDLYVVYRTTPIRYDEVNKLRDALNENLLNIDLNGYTPECVATVLKKFFHELPDPLIPVARYQSFIDASMLDDQQAVERMKAIIQDMAPHHSKTLHYFMRHLIRICRLQFMRGNKQQPTMLLQNWCHILMRPAWERIVLFVANIKNHLRVLELLMYKLDWNEPLPEFLSIPAVPPRKTSRSSGSSVAGMLGSTKKSIIASPDGGPVGGPLIESDYSTTTALGSNVSTQQQSGGVPGAGMLLPSSSPLITDPDTPQELRDAEWYWGKISRDVAKEKMMDAADGSFLVRDAINDAGEYTLVLKKDGTDRPIKIYHKNGKYGFTQECTFESLVAMINEFRTTTLKEYNTILDISLLYPISRFEDDSLYPAVGDIHQLAQSFYETVQKLTDLQNMRETTVEVYNQSQSHVDLRKQAQEAFIEADKLFNDQLQIQARYETEAQPHEKRSLALNRTLIESRLEELRKCKKNLDEDMERERERMRELQRELMKLKPEILNLSKQKDQYMEALKRQAITDAQIKQIMRDGYLSAANPDGAQELPHLDETTWLRERYSRQDAEKKLAGKPTGTFLIRARNAGHYALSIACDGRVNHCIIHQTERGYGFAEPYFIYDSLKSLVVHYATNSLEEHNDLLQTTLKYPAFAPIVPVSAGGGSGSGGAGGGSGSGGSGGGGGGPSSSSSSSTSRQQQQQQQGGGPGWPGMTSFAA